jgi:tRNA pseudouridine32 synthase/23S rRNA pseudouridine746 synthase
MARTPFLPTRDGISPSLVWLPHGPWKTLGEFFAFRFPMVTAESWADRMARGEVVDDLGVALSLDSPFRIGACVFYYRQRRDETPIPFEEKILFLNDQLLVVDKPHFVSVTPGGRYLRETLLARLKRSTSIDTLTPIHRLDRETAGVMMFSVDPATRSLWQSLFRHQKVNKVYEAVAPFCESMSFPQEISSCIVRDDKFFRMREIEAEANAFTSIEFVERRGLLALYRLYPRTGKMHQLRVHMNSLGIPILNDRFYPAALPAGTDDFSAPLQLLARSLSFIDPVSGERRVFESNFKLQVSAD